MPRRLLPLPLRLPPIPPGPEVSGRQCPRDCGAWSAALTSGAAAERRDVERWGGESGLLGSVSNNDNLCTEVVNK